MVDVIVIGFNMIDLIIYIGWMFVEGEMIEVLEFNIGYGGKGVN